MFVVRRNGVIVSALVIMVAVAGYLNFTDKSAKEVSLDENNTYPAIISEEDISVLPDDMAENGFDAITAAAQGDEGSAIFVNSSLDSNQYFVSAKLEREQSRAAQEDILSGIMESTNISQAERDKSAAELRNIQSRIEKENAAESMIESKGFSKAYVRIDGETVDVVVESGELTEAQIAQIMDIAKRKTGFSEDKIRISVYKK